jgi:hypothetical protein
MSFDLYLERLVSGESAEVDKVAVLEQLRRHCPDREDKWGVYDVRFPDGSHVEFVAKGLESAEKFSGCAFHLRGFTPLIVEFVLFTALALRILRHFLVRIIRSGGDIATESLARRNEGSW